MLFSGVASLRSYIIDRLPSSLVLHLKSLRDARRRNFIDEADFISKIEANRPSPPDSVLVDVGAHHGNVTRLFLDKGWSVVAYEPDLANRRVLERRIGNHPRLQISGSAVSDTPAEGASLFTSSVSTGISALAPFHHSHQPTANVDVVTLAMDLDSRGIRNVEFLKIDIEGYDFFAAKGFDWTRKPRFVLYEFEDRKTAPLGYSQADSSEFFAELGYRIVYSVWEPIEEYGSRHRWRGLFAEPPPDISDCWGNIMCFRDSRDVPGTLNTRDSGAGSR